LLALVGSVALDRKIAELVGRLVEELASSSGRIAFPDDPLRSIGISIARLPMTNV
jgi:hypothetical protein